MDDNKYSFIFHGYQTIQIIVKGETTISELINTYLKRIQKANLLVNNIDNICFLYNATKIKISDYPKKVCEYFFLRFGNSITVVNSYDYKCEFEIKDKIKENTYTCVYKAKLKSPSINNVDYVAVKKIFKNKIKEEMEYNLCQEEITDEDFKPEIEKFNKEIRNMEICRCENSVRIFNYYDTEEEFIIVMELCDENLFKKLARTKNGFSPEEIKKILLQLNNVFKIMNKNNISHRDIKLNNILVKYLNEDKSDYKILLSDYGISNQLSSLTKKFMTHTGTQLIMAPEILNDEEYTNKCDLWSLGVNIFQMYTKQFPYVSKVEKGILNLIEKHKQTILEVIKDEKLKDLLSKLLVRNPDERISWEEYFEHPFFK